MDGPNVVVGAASLLLAHLPHPPPLSKQSSPSSELCIYPCARDTKPKACFFFSVERERESEQKSDTFLQISRKLTLFPSPPFSPSTFGPLKKLFISRLGRWEFYFPSRLLSEVRHQNTTPRKFSCQGIYTSILFSPCMEDSKSPWSRAGPIHFQEEGKKQFAKVLAPHKKGLSDLGKGECFHGKMEKFLAGHGQKGLPYASGQKKIKTRCNSGTCAIPA